MADYRLLEIDYTVAPVANDIPIYDGVDWAPGAVSTILDADLNAIAALAGTDGILCKTAANTWALRGLAAPAAGFTITNPRGIAGDPTFVLSDDLAALEALASTGLMARTAANTYALRTLTMPAAGISGSNLDGVSGNPTLSLANDLSALEALSSTGIACRTTTDTWAQRTLAAPSAGLTISNAGGVAGNPTFALADDLAALEALASTGFAARTGTSTWATYTLTGTTNQISITNGAGGGNPVFSTPQDIHTSATPTFSSMNLNAASALIRNNGGGATDLLSLRGGQTTSSAQIDLYSQNHSTLPGRIDINAGSAGSGGASSASVNIGTRQAAPINFKVNSAGCWSMAAADGDFDPAADNTQNIGGSSNRVSTIGVINVDSGSSTFSVKSSGTDNVTVASGGDTTISRGNLILNTAGKTIKIKEGTNCCMGQAVLVAGTKTVSTTAVTANSRIQLTRGITGGTVGHLSVGTITAGTSFVINSTSATETSTINWEIKEPA